MFERLQGNNAGAFVPFVMIGDPDLAQSERIITQLIESGADALELGIPYSDPIADGPTIQRAAIRALEKGVTPGDCLALLGRIRARFPDIPIGLLLYSNLVRAKGIDGFYEKASEMGVDSVLVADVPIREVEPYYNAANAHGIAQIMIAPPNATPETLSAIGKHSTGYTYLLGRAGVTGAETAASTPASELIERLAEHRCAPPLLGFGISKPQQVSDAISAGAAGAISGSATVNLIEQHLNDNDAMLAALDEFVQQMKAATHR
ncbi:tryptophan synthase alpha chain [Alteromonas halophila]|uniref:Tryptophan synthase alpha chain n=2 Tax=Alteromonas halophila TaxID=516698 RepID=A0A918MV29_9ALTE|nr:tryptophan synthase alpha chain [Alteromonas halophila]